MRRRLDGFLLILCHVCHLCGGAEARPSAHTTPYAHPYTILMQVDVRGSKDEDATPLSKLELEHVEVAFTTPNSGDPSLNPLFLCENGRAAARWNALVLSSKRIWTTLRTRSPRIEGGMDPYNQYKQRC